MSYAGKIMSDIIQTTSDLFLHRCKPLANNTLQQACFVRHFLISCPGQRNLAQKHYLCKFRKNAVLYLQS